MGKSAKFMRVQSYEKVKRAKNGKQWRESGIKKARAEWKLNGRNSAPQAGNGAASGSGKKDLTNTPNGLAALNGVQQNNAFRNLLGDGAAKAEALLPKNVLRKGEKEQRKMKLKSKKIKMEKILAK